jgi:hypothetical protein
MGLEVFFGKPAFHRPVFLLPHRPDRTVTYFGRGLDVRQRTSSRTAVTFLRRRNLSSISQRHPAPLNEAFLGHHWEPAWNSSFHRRNRSRKGRLSESAEDVARAVVPGALDGFRSIANPSLFADPDHTRCGSRARTTTAACHTELHDPASHAFFLGI